MPGSGLAEFYFIAAMMLLIIVLSGCAVFFFVKTYRKEMKARDAASSAKRDAEE